MTSESCLAIIYPHFLWPLDHFLPLSPKEGSKSTSLLLILFFNHEVLLCLNKYPNCLSIAGSFRLFLTAVVMSQLIICPVHGHF